LDKYSQVLVGFDAQLATARRQGGFPVWCRGRILALPLVFGISLQAFSEILDDGIRRAWQLVPSPPLEAVFRRCSIGQESG